LFMEENGERYSYLNDMQGSAMRLLNHGGEDVISYRYDEFGTDLLGNQGQFQPFAYTGYQRDIVTGTYYAQAREYDAWSGRFTGEDGIKGSVTYPETLNVYGYCWGNPVVLVDRDGREPKFVPGDDYYYTGDVEDGLPVVKKKEQYFVPADNYTHIGYDENGIPIITYQEVAIEVGDVDLIDTTYDVTTDGLSAMDEVNNITMPKIIKEQPRPKNIGKGTWDKGIANELSKQSKFYSKANKVLEKLGYIGVGLDVFIGIYENIQAGTSWQRTASDAFVDLTISMFIFTVAPFLAEITGIILGAVIGAVFGFAPGAAVGAALGSGLGLSVLTIAYAYLLDHELNDSEIINGKTINEQMKEAMWYNINWLENLFDDLYECFE
jgi:RHS repeat-associated protein